MKAVLHIGDCREVLAAMPDNSVHAVVTRRPWHVREAAVAKGETGTGAQRACPQLGVIDTGASAG